MIIRLYPKTMYSNVLFPNWSKDIFVPEELLDKQTENLHVVTQDDGTIVLEKINTDAPASISYTYKS